MESFPEHGHETDESWSLHRQALHWIRKNHPVPSPHLPLTRLIYSDLEWAKKKQIKITQNKQSLFSNATTYRNTTNKIGKHFILLHPHNYNNVSC